MHPAPSVILFTTFSGLGFGFLFWLGLLGWNDSSIAKSWLAAILGGLFSAGGLSFSLGHLGHPERAWMALSQWRSSWLSREGVVSILCMMLFGLWAGLRLFFGIDWPILGWITALLAAGTVFTTSMIYTQLKTIPRWNHFATPLMFLAYASASGVLLYAITVNSSLLWLALIQVFLAWGMQIVWCTLSKTQTLDMAGTPESATGLGFLGRVRLFEKPHSAKNYLLNEMVHQVGRKNAVKVQRLSMIFTLIVPTVLLFVSAFFGAWLVSLLALISFMMGTMGSRWLFFAQAEHSVGLYYGKR